MDKNNESINIKDFTSLIEPLLENLKNVPHENFQISDIHDVHGNQYVNLVQEGGGVHGIALTGYTYILEKMGISFYKMAGTSAGSINTLLLSAVMTKKEHEILKDIEKNGFKPNESIVYYDTRSEKLLEYLSNKKIGEFVDGHPKWVSLIHRIFSSNEGSSKGIQYWAKRIGLLLIILFGFSQVSILLSFFDFGIPSLLKWSSVVFGISLFLVVLVIYHIRNLWLFSRKLGINPGDDFQNWVNDCLIENNISNISNLKAKLQLESENLVLKYKNKPVDNAIIKKQLALVSADISNQIKVSFPADHKLYWGSNYNISPSNYLRASMSVPFFFEPFTIDIEDSSKNDIKGFWQEKYKIDVDLEDPLYLVDGGLLSNFPMDIFYDNKETQKVPTFGIKLAYDNPLEFNSTFKFAGNIISAMRIFYDRNFSIKNEIFKQTIRTIDVGDIHWLNFNMTQNQQKELFIRGALSACIYIFHIFENELIMPKEKMEELKQKLLSIGINQINEVRPDGKKIVDFQLDEAPNFEWNKYKNDRTVQLEEMEIIKTKFNDYASYDHTFEIKSK